MFFNLITRNSRRSRKENGMFFATLLIAIIAFYIILSLSRQDVMLFLQEMESDAVNRLLGMIPVFYVMTLIILFFLIYFASKFQLERRRHEIGMYLMMGMTRNRLFVLLLAEDIRSSIIALLIGLPAAVLLSEIISLVTARLVGLGIIGHSAAVRLDLYWRNDRKKRADSFRHRSMRCRSLAAYCVSEQLITWRSEVCPGTRSI